MLFKSVARSISIRMKESRIDLKVIARRVMEKYGFVPDFPQR